MPSEDDYRLRELEARLERRMQALEADRRRATWSVRIAAVGLVVAVATLAVVALAARGGGGWTVGTLSAERVELRDGADVVRAGLGTSEGGRIELSLADREGVDRIRLTVLEDGSPGITLRDRDGRSRAVLGHLPDGTTNLVLADERGVSRVVVGLDPDGSARALFGDRVGAIRTLVGVGGDGVPVLSTREDFPEEEAEEP